MDFPISEFGSRVWALPTASPQIRPGSIDLIGQSNQIYSRTSRALDQFWAFQLEPRSTAFAAHSVEALRDGRAKLIFLNHYAIGFSRAYPQPDSCAGFADISKWRMCLFHG